MLSLCLNVLSYIRSAVSLNPLSFLALSPIIAFCCWENSTWALHTYILQHPHAMSLTWWAKLSPPKLYRGKQVNPSQRCKKEWRSSWKQPLRTEDERDLMWILIKGEDLRHWYHLWKVYGILDSWLPSLFQSFGSSRSGTCAIIRLQWIICQM